MITESEVRDKMTIKFNVQDQLSQKNVFSVLQEVSISETVKVHAEGLEGFRLVRLIVGGINMYL